MDFSDTLVNKIQNQSPNLVIAFIIFAMATAPLVAAYQFRGDLNSALLLFLSLIFLSTGAIVAKKIKKNIIKVGEIEDFVILNSDRINETKASHKEILSIVTHLNAYNHNFARKNIIEKFQCLLDKHNSHE